MSKGHQARRLLFGVELYMEVSNSDESAAWSASGTFQILFARACYFIANASKRQL